MLPVACRRCIHLIAELGLTSNQSAASRREAPDSTPSTTRSRNSKEHGFGIDPPSKPKSMPARFNYPSLPGNPDITQPKSALTREDDDEARAIIDDEEGSMRSDLKVLVGMDGKPLCDGESAIEAREATAAQHDEWKQSRDQGISDGKINLDAGNNPSGTSI